MCPPPLPPWHICAISRDPADRCVYSEAFSGWTAFFVIGEFAFTGVFTSAFQQMFVRDVRSYSKPLAFAYVGTIVVGRDSKNSTPNLQEHDVHF